MTLLDGKTTAAVIETELRQKTEAYLAQGLRPPGLAVLLIGEDAASQTYVRNKIKACERAGFRSTFVRLPEDIAPQVVLSHIDVLNADDETDGFFIQLPVPAHLKPLGVSERVAPSKDVDGLNVANLGKIACGSHDGFVPATPAGILELLRRYKIATVGKNVVVVGRSQIVGTPMALLLSQSPWESTVTICHRQTVDLPSFTKNADILIVAVGKPGLITAEMVKDGAVVIDVGINSVNGKLVGDVDFQAVAPKCAAITPVPGGVGPMTIAALLTNTFFAYEKNIKVAQ